MKRRCIFKSSSSGPAGKIRPHEMIPVMPIQSCCIVLLFGTEIQALRCDGRTTGPLRKSTERALFAAAGPPAQCLGSINVVGSGALPVYPVGVLLAPVALI